jgi:ankyrin repeat protein
MKSKLLVILLTLALASCGSERNKELVYKSSLGDARAVEQLIMQGAEPNYASFDDGLTPLIAAAQYGHIEVVKLLIAAGADPSLKDGGGSPLFWSAFFLKKDVFEYLQSVGAKLNATPQNIKQLTLELKKNKSPEFLQMVLKVHSAEAGQK